MDEVRWVMSQVGRRAVRESGGHCLFYPSLESTSRKDEKTGNKLKQIARTISMTRRLQEAVFAD
jgi:hypothetical protein